MKLTKAKREWVMKKVEHYSELLQVMTPTVYMTMAEYDQWKKDFRRVNNLKKGTRVGRTTCLGVCHRDMYFIVVLVKRSPSLIHLDDTIRHEMIHLAKPSYNHRSKEFADRMKRLKQGKLKNGRFCK